MDDILAGVQTGGNCCSLVCDSIGGGQAHYGSEGVKLRCTMETNTIRCCLHFNGAQTHGKAAPLVEERHKSDKDLKQSELKEGKRRSNCEHFQSFKWVELLALHG